MITSCTAPATCSEAAQRCIETRAVTCNIDEIAVPTRYFEEASSVGFRRSVVYGLSTLRVVARYLLHRTGVRRSPKLRPRRPASEPGSA